MNRTFCEYSEKKMSLVGNISSCSPTSLTVTLCIQLFFNQLSTWRNYTQTDSLITTCTYTDRTFKPLPWKNLLWANQYASVLAKWFSSMKNWKQFSVKIWAPATIKIQWANRGARKLVFVNWTNWTNPWKETTSIYTD